ncbi:hypothetical protein SISNIDRAFT_406281, partial [Sistotremastrum niveocremeum HHB9708]
DLSSRHGFKQLHKNFAAAFSRLDQCWNKYQGTYGSKHVMGGIVTVYGRMATDSILRNQLHKSGFLSKVLIAIQDPITRVQGLQTLHTVTHHGGSEIRDDIALKTTPVLVPVLQESLEDDEAAEYCISILSHTFASVFLKDLEIQVPAETLRQLQVSKVIDLTLDRIQRKGLDLDTSELTHGVSLIAAIPLKDQRSFMKNPKALRLMIACLRSPFLGFRCQGMVALYRLHTVDVVDERRDMSPLVMMKAASGNYPRQIKEALTTYGLERCDINIMMYINSTMHDAILQCSRDGDLAKLGKALAQNIMATEYSIPSGNMYLDRVKPRPPFVDWVDGLPYCAKALRAQNDFDTADIIELKYLIMKRNWDVLDRVGKAAIARNPKIPFFYYAMMMKSDKDMIKWAKKGLQCEQIPPYIRWGLHYYAAWRAMDRAFEGLAEVNMDEPGWEEGVAYLRCAYQDLKAYIDGAPPDSKSMLPALNRFILVRMIMDGPALGTDLKEISDILEKQRGAEELHEFFWGTDPPATQVNRTRKHIMDNLAKSTEEWKVFIERTAIMTPGILGAQDDKQDENNQSLEKALDVMQLDGEHIEHKAYGSYMFSGMNDKKIELYRCTRCHNPSAALRKCSRCGNSRYCDAECQKQDWKNHKKVCKSAEISA